MRGRQKEVDNNETQSPHRSSLCPGDSRGLHLDPKRRLGQALHLHAGEPLDRSRFSEIYPFNAVFSGWSWTTYPADWADDGSFTRNIRRAIATWETAVPQLDFVENQREYYLLFEKGYCGRFSDACMRVEERDISHRRRAAYLLWADIRLSLAQPRLRDIGKEDQLRHEIGHWIGLDEVYCERCIDTCTRHVDSVMNATYTSNGQNCTGVHAPTQRDINAVTAYWNGDRPESVVLTERPNNILKLTWTDALWSESTHWVMLYYWDTTTSTYVLAEQDGYTPDTGFHKDSIPRTIQKQWNVRARGWPTDTSYFAGVKGWSWPWRSFGATTWSNTVHMD